MNLNELIQASPDAWRLTETAREAQIFPWGTWQHPTYGKMVFDEQFFTDIIANFNGNVRGKRIPIDSEHMVDPQGAKGYIASLRMEPGVGLFATPEWTEYGLSLLRDDRFKYFSPTFLNDWKHPNTGEKYKNVLTAAALTVDPFCLGMQEYRLSEGWTREEVTLSADVTKPEVEEEEDDEPTLEDLLAKLNEIHGKVKEHIKGCKGAPGTRHQLEMVSKLLGDIAEVKNKKKEATTMPDNVEMTEGTEAARLTEEATRLREEMKLKEGREAKLTETIRQLAGENRKMHVQAKLSEMLSKNLVKAGHQKEIEADLMKMSEISEAITLSEGTRVDMLSEVSNFVGKYCHAVKLNEEVKGTAAVDGEPAPAPEPEAKLTETQKIKKYAEENKVSYAQATVALREQKLI